MIERNFSIINNVKKNKPASSEKLIKDLTYLKNNKKETKKKEKDKTLNQIQYKTR